MLLLAAVTKLVFLTSPGSLGTGACSPVVTVQTQDDTGTATPPPVEWTVLLSGAAAYFPSTSCSDPAIDPQGGLKVSPSSPSASFRFVVPTTGSVRLSVTAGSFTATQDWTITPAAGEPSQVVFTTPSQALTQSRCSSQVAFKLADVDGHDAAPDRAITVSFAPEYVEVYSDAACTQRLQTLSIAQGAPNAFDVFIKTDFAGQYPFQAGAPGLTTGAMPITVDAPAGGCTSAAGAGWAAVVIALDAARRRKRSNRHA